MLTAKAKLKAMPVHLTEAGTLFAPSEEHVRDDLTRGLTYRPEKRARLIGAIRDSILRRSDRDQVVVLDLSGIDPWALEPEHAAYVVREAIQRARRKMAPRIPLISLSWNVDWRYQSDELGESDEDLWYDGVRKVWRTDSEIRGRTEELFWKTFVARWALFDREDPSRRLPIPYKSRPDRSKYNFKTGLLGCLPSGLGGQNLRALFRNRLLTYHAFGVESEEPRRSAKALGKLFPRYQELGWVVPRGYATSGDLRTLGLQDEVHQRARLQIWESVPAAMRDLPPAPLVR